MHCGFATASAVHVCPPGVDVTLYPERGEPSVVVSAGHETVACPFPAEAVGVAGVPGGPKGITPLECGDAGLVPAWLVAVTVNV